jgi:hypothetical protein
MVELFGVISVILKKKKFGLSGIDLAYIRSLKHVDN